MPRVVNWASTCANQTCGSAGQKGGSFMLKAATVVVGAAETGASPTGSIVTSSEDNIKEIGSQQRDS